MELEKKISKLQIYLEFIKLKKNKEKLLILETDIDDMSGEIYSYLYLKLFSADAKDVYFTNILMKKIVQHKN
jgi:uncharacterized protein (DUF111 family)